jgi:hypothetical protein
MKDLKLGSQAPIREWQMTVNEQNPDGIMRSEKSGCAVWAGSFG